jgi:pimeloyl-ACP methyl ester carboxylesterase
LRRAFCFNLVGITLVAASVIGRHASADEHARADKPRVARALVQGKPAIRLSAQDGKIDKADVVAELGRVGGLDLRAVGWLLPDGQIDLNEAKTRRRLSRVNAFLGRYTRTKIEHDEKIGEPELVIEIDRPRVEADKRRAKTTIRTVGLAVVDPRGKLRAKNGYGLHVDPGALNAQEKRLVVAIHGYNARAGAMDAFLDPLRAAKHPCATFVYANDQAVAESAKLLSGELRTLAKRDPKRRVALLAFSMGGLVARAALEDEAIDPGNVERLVMIAPPNQGTVCARFARGADLYEHLWRDREWEPRRLVAASMLDGMGEARVDLCPDSQFLGRLNAGSRNSKVRYSILLGDGHQLSEEFAASLSASIERARSKNALAQLFGPKLDRLRADLRELSEPGDGVISLRRGRLAGVKDIEVLPFSHVDAFSDLTKRHIQALHEAIAARLE